MQTPEIEINGRGVGPGFPCLIIAEAGVNHNGSLEMAFQLIDAAVQAGADAIKFQAFKADTLVTKRAPKAAYQRELTGEAESQYEMLKKLELSFADHEKLLAYCQQEGILFMSSPFDEECADMLEELGVAAYKIPSGEITNLPYLEHIAAKGKLMIVSTGMSFLAEVETAVRAIEAAGNPGLILLHCVSAYPADPQDINLRAMETLAAAFKHPVGFSDHTKGIEIPLAAVALGACVVEKHFTLDKNLPGPDHKASLEPDELVELVQGIRKVESALGSGRKGPAHDELETSAVARKSLVAAADLPAGTTLSDKHIAVRRPGTGLPPAMKPRLIGKTTSADLNTGDLFTLEMLQ
jgi:N-acetylneuraminate synthase